MSAYFFIPSRLASFRRTATLLALGLAWIVPTLAQAQTPSPDPAPPISSPPTDPTPAASPTPVADPSPSSAVLTVVTGPFDMNAYRQSRTPSAGVALSPTSVPVSKSGAQTAQPNGRKAASASAALEVSPLRTDGGVFSVVCLGSLNGSAAPPPANVALQFDAARAGTPVWVQTLDGGTLQAITSEGKTVTAVGGFSIDLDGTGKLYFSYQAPARSDRFQVLIRMDNISTILPFEVLEPVNSAAYQPVSPAATPAANP